MILDDVDYVSFCVAGVARMALGWLRWRAWTGLVAGDAAALCVAGVALADIHLRLAWQAWHLVTSTFVLRGRRGTYVTGLALVSQTIFVTHHLSHTTLSHTIFHTPSLTHPLSHPTLSHTIFDTPSFTHHFVTHHLSHAIFHTQLCHIPSLTRDFVTHHLSHTIFVQHHL